MFTKLVPAVIALTMLLSCGTNDKKSGAETAMPHQHDSSAVTKPNLTAVKLDSDKDFVCGMPIKAGVEDTASYKDKMYGFCSKECKEDFLKSPETYVAKK